MSFAIFTDTSANLPTPMAKEYGIGVIPLSYTANGQAHECLDTETFDSGAYYASMKEGVTITTSQVNPQKYVDYMEPTLKAGKDILFVGMSAGISGSFSSALIAKDQLEETYPERKIYVVDSMGASLGEGLLVLRAHNYMEQGMEIAEVAERLAKERDNMYQLFTVDDLMHLRKGGRLSNAAAVMGTLLNVKPLLKGNENGKIVSFEKVRGRKAVIARLAQKYDALVREPEKQVIGISHANCREDAEYLASLLREKHPPKDIMIVEHEPVTGSYLGPNALALYFCGDADVRLK